MFFIIILAMITLSIAGTAAFFSVYGLAYTFKSAFYAVIFMGSSLEAGKLITASFLYRYWKKLSFALRTYLMFAVFILMIITSVGIFSFLSKGYQEDSQVLRELNQKIEHINVERTKLQARKDEISDTKSSAVDSVINTTDNTKRWQANMKNKMAQSIVVEDKEINERLAELSTELYKLEDTKINTQIHVGPIIYIAQALGKDVDNATTYIILLLIVVFDPLAVALTIGFNIALKHYNDDKQQLSTAVEAVLIEAQDEHIITKDMHQHVNELLTRKQILENVRKGI